MICQVELSLLADLPEDVQVGDELDLTARITVKSVEAELIDVSTVAEKAWILGSAYRVVAFANKDFTEVRP